MYCLQDKQRNRLGPLPGYLRSFKVDPTLKRSKKLDLRINSREALQIILDAQFKKYLAAFYTEASAEFLVEWAKNRRGQVRETMLLSLLSIRSWSPAFWKTTGHESMKFEILKRDDPAKVDTQINPVSMKARFFISKETWAAIQINHQTASLRKCFFIRKTA